MDRLNILKQLEQANLAKKREMIINDRLQHVYNVKLNDGSDECYCEYTGYPISDGFELVDESDEEQEATDRCLYFRLYGKFPNNNED